jgi:hypothetical protein
LTILSFWWLYARKGRLHVVRPHVAGFYQDQQGPMFVLRLPLLFQRRPGVAPSRAWYSSNVTGP